MSPGGRLAGAGLSLGRVGQPQRRGTRDRTWSHLSPSGSWPAGHPTAPSPNTSRRRRAVVPGRRHTPCVRPG